MSELKEVEKPKHLVNKIKKKLYWSVEEFYY